MGLFQGNKPKIKVQTTKRDGFSGWLKCTECQKLIHVNELEKNLHCCPNCQYHYRFSAEDRIHLLTDENSFTPLFTYLQSYDPLHFYDTESYTTRLEKAKKKTGADEAIIVGKATVEGLPVALGVMNFAFMGGSMGSVVGERLTCLMEYALSHSLPLIVVSASGGARMQESILSLMQMAKTSAALAKLHEQGLPYISILTNPTTGGVIASFAALGDIILAEPKALICFTGPRVLEQTIGHKLPEKAQKSEFLLEHGMIDAIVERSALKEKVATLLRYLQGNGNIELESPSFDEGKPKRRVNKIHSLPL